MESKKGFIMVGFHFSTMHNAKVMYYQVLARVLIEVANSTQIIGMLYEGGSG